MSNNVAISFSKTKCVFDTRWWELSWVLLFTQKFLLISKWNDQNTPAWVNSRRKNTLKLQRGLAHAGFFHPYSNFVSIIKTNAVGSGGSATPLTYPLVSDPFLKFVKADS